MAVQQIGPDRVTPIYVDHLDYAVRSSRVGGKTVRELTPTQRATLPLPAHERALVWTDGDLEEGATPEHYIFPSARAALAFDQTLAQIKGWFQAQVVPGPDFVAIASERDLQAHFRKFGEDPELLARYRATKWKFPATGGIWLDLASGQWVAQGWQPGTPVATLAPVPPKARRPRP